MENYKQIISKLDPGFLSLQVGKPEGEIGKLIAHALDVCNEEHIKACYQKARTFKPKRILEIGFGRGSYLQDLLFSKSTQLFGIDISETMVELAVQLNPSDKINLEQGDAHSLPYENSVFDTVISVNSIYFWKDIETCLREIRRVLKPNGQVIIGFSPKKTLMQLSYTWSHFNHYSVDELIDLVLEAELKVSDITSNSHNCLTYVISAKKVIAKKRLNNTSSVSLGAS